MSLLNITNDGLPNVLVVLHATVLRATKPIPKDELLEAVATAAIVEDGGQQVRQTLNRWTELGLFQEVDGAVTVADRPPSRRASALELLTFTRRMACKQALAEDNNRDLWATQSARSADLTRSLAWMLAQDAYRAGFGDFEAQEAQQITDPDRQLLRNSTRRTGLQYWARFLGFSRQPYADIDPTVAIRDALPEVLELGSDIAAAEFVDRLAGVLPVLDRGRWSAEVLAVVDSAALPPRQVGQLSTVLSRALLNLRETGERLLQRKADVGTSVVLTGAQGVRPDLNFQWIARPAVGASR